MNFPWYWMITLIGASVLMLRSHWGEVKLFMSWVAGVIGLYAGMTLWLLLKNHPGVGACAVGRYYLVLMPVGVVALSAFVVEAWRRMTSWKMRSLVVLIALAVLLPGLVRAAGWLLQGAWPEYLRS